MTLYQYHGIFVDSVQNLTKGFFHIRFSNHDSVGKVLSRGPQYVHSTLLIYQPWHKDF